MTIRDSVLFLMPRRRDYQFAAAAVVQTFVNRYQERCKVSDVSGGRAQYELVYELRMPQEDLEFFTVQCGLKLDQMPGKVVTPDMLVDLTEKRVDRFRGTRRHLVQVCGLMCGVSCHPLPDMRKVTLRTGDWTWYEYPNMRQVLAIKNDEYTGVIAHAGPVTYLAASMGLAVVEILSAGCEPDWLSKWKNIYYRVVLDDGNGVDIGLVDRAQRNVQQLLTERVRKEASCHSSVQAAGHVAA